MLQCRAIENNKDRLSCYDKSIQPTRTKVAEKFESRDQCPDEKDDDKRLSCYDRFFSPTFTPSVNSKSKTEKLVTTEAQQPNLSEISKCRAENDKEARLNCYDKLFPQNEAVQSESQLEKATDAGKWHTSITTSPIDDSKNVILSLESDDYIRTPFGEAVTPTLFIACREKKTEVFLSWDVYLGLEQCCIVLINRKQLKETG